MAQINPPKPLVAPTSEDLREDNLTTAYARSSMFFDEHRTLLLGLLGGIVALAAAVGGWLYWQDQRSEEAQQLLGAILTQYEAGNWEAALEGTDDAPGLLEIAETYGSTATGEQATFLAADALFQLGRTDEALEMYEAYSGDDLLEASALAGQAAIFEQQGDAARAADLYQRAAGVSDSPASAPGYLLDAARAHAAAGDPEAALDNLQRVVDDFGDTPEARLADVEIGRVTALRTASGTPEGTVRPAPVVADTAATAPEAAAN